MTESESAEGLAILANHGRKGTVPNQSSVLILAGTITVGFLFAFSILPLDGLIFLVGSTISVLIGVGLFVGLHIVSPDNLHPSMMRRVIEIDLDRLEQMFETAYFEERTGNADAFRLRIKTDDGGWEIRGRKSKPFKEITEIHRLDANAAVEPQSYEEDFTLHSPAELTLTVDRFNGALVTGDDGIWKVDL